MRWKRIVVAAAVVVVVAGAWAGRRAWTVWWQRGGVATTGVEGVGFDFDGPAGADGLPAPWRANVSKGEMRAAARAVDGRPGKALWVRSEGASFFVGDNTRTFDPKEYPVLRWSWRAVTLPTGGDVRLNALMFGDNRNDQAVQVLVAFEGNRVLSYIWDTTAPAGLEVDEPSVVGTVKTKVVESGAGRLGQWVDVTVNIAEDFRKRFGEPPPRVIGVAVQSNANHTGSVGEGLVGRIVAGKR